NQLKPNTTLQQLQGYGVVPSMSMSPDTKASFLVLDMSNNDQQYWLGFNNFYVISRYNPRLNYAMAVFQLSQAIKQQYKQG
ncbi:MAG: lytic murein transglycosylase, partial [Gammaproteobacteria bacterium]